MITERAYVVFDGLVCTFGLAVRLGVERGGEVGTCSEQAGDFSPPGR